MIYRCTSRQQHCVAAIVGLVWLSYSFAVVTATHYPFSLYPYKAKGCYCSGRILAASLPPPAPPPLPTSVVIPNNIYLSQRQNSSRQNGTSVGTTTTKATSKPSASFWPPPFIHSISDYGGFAHQQQQRRVVNISDTPLEHIRLMQANSTFSFEWLEGWRCSCQDIAAIPNDMPPALSQLVISNTNIAQITKAQLAKYKVLKTFELFTAESLHYIEPGAFAACRLSIRSISIVGAPRLSYIDDKVFESMPKLAILRIRRSGLVIPPVIRNLASKNAMSEIDFEGCNIEKIPSNALAVSVARISFDDNAKLKSIENDAFYGSKIRKLSFRNNHALNDIKLQAFSGIEHLSVLVLNNTAVSDLPTHGLGEVTELHISHTTSLTRFTNILELRSLQVAYVTYPFHCCAFRYPELFAPHEAKIELRKLREYHEAMCELKRKGKLSDHILYNGGSGGGGNSQKQLTPHPQQSVTTGLRRALRSLSGESENSTGVLQNPAAAHTLADTGLLTVNTSHETQTSRSTTTTTAAVVSYLEREQTYRQTDYSAGGGVNDITVYELSSSDLGEYAEDLSSLLFLPSEGGGVNNDAQIELICDVDVGLQQFGLQNIECYPEPDAFNPCEDVMGSWVLRVFAWIVLTLALVGNAAVLIVLIVSGSFMSSLRRDRSDMRLRNATVQKVFVGNLAFADFCMGMYLLLLAIADARSCGEYFNYAKIWQHTGYGCRFAGLFATFASVLSTYVLACITLERWYVIRNAINFQNRLNVCDAWKVMMVGWLIALVAAVMPMFDISDYGMTSICLPMRVTKTYDLTYLLSLLLFNGSIFVLICFCYVHIYFAVNKAPEGNVEFTTKLGGRVISMRTARRSIPLAASNHQAIRLRTLGSAEESEEEHFVRLGTVNSDVATPLSRHSPISPTTFDVRSSSQRSNISSTPATTFTLIAQDSNSSSNGSIFGPPPTPNGVVGHNKRAKISKYMNAFRTSRFRSTFDNTQQQDRKLAMKMALLIFTNFACWAPITFFGTTAALGWPLISISSSKVLLVFFFPLNSCTNPFLYAILTNSFREDLLAILRFLGLKRSKQQHTFATTAAGGSRRVSRGSSLSMSKKSNGSVVNNNNNNNELHASRHMTSPLRKSNSSNTRYHHTATTTAAAAVPTTSTILTRKQHAEEKRTIFTLTLSVLTKRTSTETTKSRELYDDDDDHKLDKGIKKSLLHSQQFHGNDAVTDTTTDCIAGPNQVCCFCAQPATDFSTDKGSTADMTSGQDISLIAADPPKIHVIDTIDDEQYKL